MAESRRPLQADALVMVALAAVLLLLGSARAERLPAECGSLNNGYGPYDYTNPVHFRDKLPVVERHHFTRDVEALRKGQGGRVGSDLDYTLRAFPNHHRALWAMFNYHRRYPHMRVPPQARFPTICYFQRAVTFAPADPTAHMLYGLFLAESGDRDGARREFERSIELAPESSEAHYNYGLLLLKLGDQDKALHHAQRAYAIGYPLNGLRNKLKRLGIWEEPDAEAPAVSGKDSGQG